MDKNTYHLNRLPFLLAALLVLASLLGCQSGGPAPSASGAPASPTTAPSTGAPAAQDPASGETAGGEQPAVPPSGDSDLSDPTAGLAGLAGYRQQLTLSVEGTANGEPIRSQQEILRQVSGEDESVQVHDASGSEDAFGSDDAFGSAAPVYLYTARLGDYQYTQEAEGGACRSAPLAERPWTDLNPARRLPPVSGMQEAGQEEYAGMPAVHYTFDERAVLNQAGENGTARGELWVARGDGAVLSYELTIEIDSLDFSGTRAWSYTLSQVDEEPAISLPEPCMPVLDDLPVLAGAEDILLEPGFLRYTVAGGSEQALAFYAAELPELGWTALPGSEPEGREPDGSQPGAAGLEAGTTVLTYAQETGAGGRLLVIRIRELDGRLEIVAQTANTLDPVYVDPSGEAPDGAEPGDPEDDGEDGSEAEGADDGDRGSEGAEAQSLLPEDLPEHPGAKEVSRAETFVMFETSGDVEEISGFYKTGLEESGWTLDQEIEAYGTLTQMWSREGKTLVVAFMQQGDTIRIMITAGEA